MTKQTKQKPLTEEEIDQIVIEQVDDDDAWEEEIVVTPVSRPRAGRIAGRPAAYPSQRHDR